MPHPVPDLMELLKGILPGATSAALIALISLVGAVAGGWIAAWGSRSAARQHLKFVEANDQRRRLIEMGVEPVVAAVETIRSQLLEFAFQGYETNHLTVRWQDFHAGCYRLQSFFRSHKLTLDSPAARHDFGRVDPISTLLSDVFNTFSLVVENGEEFPPREVSSARCLLEQISLLLEFVDEHRAESPVSDRLKSQWALVCDIARRLMNDQRRSLDYYSDLSTSLGLHATNHTARRALHD